MSPKTHVHSQNTALTPLFGYFCVETDGLETVLVRVEPNNRWAFPINTEFNPSVHTAFEAIDIAVMDFCESSGLFGRAVLLASDLRLPDMRSVLIGPSATEQYVVPEETVRGVFFKIKLNTQVGLSTSDFAWEPKTTLFTSPEQCVDTMYLYAINRDFIYGRFGFKILECVDLLVFRVRDECVEFLMLSREDERLGIVGWEYPKGGILFHETLYEGSLRELEEETGTTSYAYRGYLGHQIVDVSKRKRIDYDTLRVHGLTFQFTGVEDVIRPSAATKEGLRNPTWNSWKEARKKVWMKDYGREFFDRWQAKQNEILADLL